jgi:hypothetical protein
MSHISLDGLKANMSSGTAQAPLHLQYLSTLRVSDLHMFIATTLVQYLLTISRISQ